MARRLWMVMGSLMFTVTSRWVVGMFLAFCGLCVLDADVPLAATAA